jgi:MutS domain V
LEQYYYQRKQEVEKNLASSSAQFNRLSNIRLALLLLGFVVLYFLFQWSAEAVAIFIPAWLASFYFLVQAHDKSEALKNALLFEKDVIQNELNILADTFSNAYDHGKEYQNEKHPFSSDLDIFGEGSLFAYVNRAATENGRKLLADKFLHASSKGEIEQLHDAVLELKNLDAWRTTFQAVLYSVKSEDTETLKSLKNPPDLKGEFILKLYPVLSWLLGGFIVFTFYSQGIEAGLGVLFTALAFNYGLVGLNRKISEAYFQKISSINRNLKQYREAVEKIKQQPWQSEICQKYAKNTLGDSNPIDAFSSIARKLEMRKNQFAAIFLYSVSPFDLVELGKLKKWIQNNPDFFENIIASIAWFEYLDSLGTLAFNHSDWQMPSIISSEKPTINATEIAHPLIQDAVSNSFTLDSANALSIITGSNMSGKSTFLRTLGLNTVLAYCGSVVSAEKLEISEGILLYTYMRIKDSLLQNASTFKAEIDRLKMLIDAIKTQPNALLLVDEMLRGTNSEDKLKGSMAFMESIVAGKTMALIATHDLRMTDIVDKYPHNIKNYFFEYQSENNELRFDYKIKPGICQSFNATELLRSAGLIL